MITNILIALCFLQIQPKDLASKLQVAKPNDVIVVADGVINGPLEIATSVTIKAQNKWKFVITGARTHGVHILAEGVKLDGIQIQGAVYSGIKSEKSKVGIFNCWIHHNALNGIEAHEKTAVEIKDCLVERNGTHPNLCHGIYMDGDSNSISGCIVRHNAAMGIALGGLASNTKVTRTLVHDNGTVGIGIWRFRGGRNTVEHCTVANHQYSIRVVGLVDEAINNCIFYKGGLLKQYMSMGSEPNVSAPWNYNICYPTNLVLQGPNGSSNIPKFVDANFGVYWLAQQTVIPDAGAYTYNEALTKPEARSAWPYNPWAYQFDPSKGMPDVWKTVQSISP